MHLVDYVAHNAKYSFKAKPFNEVDALVFAQLAYYDYSLFEDGLTFEEIANHKNVIKATSLKNLIGDADERMFNLVITSRRYKNTQVKWHVSERDKEKAMQFSATTFILSKNKAVVAFRGTDGTVIGWNEDLNMTYMFPIPSQAQAQRYLNYSLNNMHIEDVIVVGHSKGGNLAVYASIMAKEKYQPYITAVYNFDGPGFTEAFYDLDAYQSLQPCIHKYIPEQSSIGRMMSERKENIVIKSDAAYAMQHWAHTWLIDDDKFVYSDSTDFFSESVDVTTASILENMTPEEREDAVKVLFEILFSTGKEYMDDIIKDRENILFCIKQYFTLKDKGENVKKMVVELIKPMARMYTMKGKEEAGIFIVEKKNQIVDKIKETFSNKKKRNYRTKT